MHPLTVFFVLSTACFVILGWFLGGIEVWLLAAVSIIGLVVRVAIGETDQWRQRQTEVIESHLAELTRRRQQLVYETGYGVVDYSKWHKEMKRFIRTVLQQPTTGKNVEDQVQWLMNHIDHLVLEHIGSTQHQLNGYNPDMSGFEYEHFCAGLLRACGIDANTTSGSGDQGADILASIGGERYAIQCKHYTGNVGNAAIQEVMAARAFYDADHAVVVTNATFTPSARQLAGKANVRLMHHDDLHTLATAHTSVPASAASSHTA